MYKERYVVSILVSRHTDTLSAEKICEMFLFFLYLYKPVLYFCEFGNIKILKIFGSVMTLCTLIS